MVNVYYSYKYLFNYFCVHVCSSTEWKKVLTWDLSYSNHKLNKFIFSYTNIADRHVLFKQQQIRYVEIKDYEDPVLSAKLCLNWELNSFHAEIFLLFNSKEVCNTEAIFYVKDEEKKGSLVPCSVQQMCVECKVFVSHFSGCHVMKTQQCERGSFWISLEEDKNENQVIWICSGMLFCFVFSLYV